ncbi:MAG TPA: thiamine-phosphate kinase, partial [Myxococcota bacterium]|nr:thiamine-phosphate kinase [Myxococcota bacterium]
MQLRDLGEFGLIARIERAARAAGAVRSRGVVLGIGDDAAILRARPGEDWVVTTDAMVEGVHFRWETQSAHCIGRRALVANLSDLAAMGARPLGFALALALPPGLALRRIDGLIAGMLAEAVRHRCPLIGGNVTRARQTSLTIAAQGAVERGRALTRSGARAGDRIFVTGALGASALELARSRAGLGRIRSVPTPRLRAGRALASLPGVGACIDVSDGLLADLAHLLERSGCSARLDVERVPRPPRFDAACHRLGLDPVELASRGGEDYELLFTL